MYWVDGIPQDTISISDRSFQYGDGGFTTMLTRDGVIQHWHRHQKRMEACLKHLGIDAPNWNQVYQWLNIAALPNSKAGLKLHISRGNGGRGYSRDLSAQPCVTISHFQYPVHYQQWQHSGVSLGLCSHQLGLCPMLAGHKHNNRLEQVMLKSEMDDKGFVDGIAIDIHNHVIETTMANIFWVKGETIFTPDLSMSGVAGVMRNIVIEQAEQQDIPLIVIRSTMDDLRGADEVFITNSILGVAPIVGIEEIRYPIGRITRNFRRLQHRD